MNIISFSLWGDNPLYNIGAIKNADLALQIYPDWYCYYYCNKCVPEKTINELKKRNNTKIFIQNKIGNINSATDRFLAVDLPETERIIFRDTDSRLSNREKLAVDEWIYKNYDIHIMRDHPSHGWFIQAGMFGLKANKFKGEMNSVLNAFNFTNIKGQDQDFISAYLKYKINKENCSYIEHDPFYAKKPFPQNAKRGADNGGVYFIGQRIEVENELDVYDSNVYEAVIKEITDIECK